MTNWDFELETVFEKVKRNIFSDKQSPTQVLHYCQRRFQYDGHRSDNASKLSAQTPVSICGKLKVSVCIIPEHNSSERGLKRPFVAARFVRPFCCQGEFVDSRGRYLLNFKRKLLDCL